MRFRRPLALLAPLLALLLIPASAAALPECSRHPQVRVLDEGRGLLESVAIDRRGRLFYTDNSAGELLMLRRPNARPKVIADGIDAPGGIVFRRDGTVLVGFGDSIEQAADGPLDPEAGLLQVDPRTGRSKVKVEGLQMANGISRGPGKAIYASIDIGAGGIDRVRRGKVRLNWSEVESANGLVVDSRRKHLYANQTFVAPPRIARVPLGAPDAAKTYFAAGPEDAGAGLDGLARDRRDRLYAAANGAGEIWRVDGRDSACTLARMQAFPAGPSDLAFGRGKRGFSRKSLYVTTFGGELLELVGARGRR